jgi:hypothetical protein
MTIPNFCFICGTQFTRHIRTKKLVFVVVTLPSGAEVRTHKCCEADAKALGKLSKPLDRPNSDEAPVTPPARDPDTI